jgi:hypothetical protein
VKELPLILVLLLAVVPTLATLGIRLIRIALHRGEEPERSGNPWPAVRLRRARRVTYVVGALYGLAIMGCLIWWLTVDLAPRLGIVVSSPFLAWIITWMIVLPGYVIVLAVLRVRRLMQKVPRPSPDASGAEKNAWKNRYYEEMYAGNTPKNLGKAPLGGLGLVALMCLSGWIIALVTR